MTREPSPIEWDEFDAAALMSEHPPVLRHPNKRAVFDIACPPGSTCRGRIRYSRWREMSLPSGVDPAAAAGRIDARPGFFDYKAVSGGQLSDLAGRTVAVEWHVNFADPHLFVAYASPLFAQDETQAAEHPALGALREALLVAARPPMTVGGDGAPTPILVAGVERRCRIATDRNAAEGRPAGLYGNAFARAAVEAVRRATTTVDPPTTTNLIAMAAPSGGHGRYRTEEIEGILTTAFTGFSAAVQESTRLRGGPGPVVVHTGYWGCGAFGGQRVLMAALQLLAAGMAGLDLLVFHTGPAGGDEPLQEAIRLVRGDHGRGPSARTVDLIEEIAAAGFEWGVSDGN